MQKIDDITDEFTNGKKYINGLWMIVKRMSVKNNRRLKKSVNNY